MYFLSNLNKNATVKALKLIIFLNLFFLFRLDYIKDSFFFIEDQHLKQKQTTAQKIMELIRLIFEV